MSQPTTSNFLDSLAAALPASPTPPPTTVQPVRENPWRRLGKRFDPTSNADHAISRSGLDWRVSKVGLRTDDLQPVPGSYAIRRDDSKRILGVVGKDFTPVQNAEAFSFFRDLAGEHHITFETAGYFQGGAITWVLAHLPDLGIRIGDDEAKTYMLISNGHIGNRPLTVAPTTVRVICWNTLQMAERQIAEARRSRPGLAAGFQVRHFSGIHAALDDIKTAYAATLQAHVVTTEAWKHLASKPLTKAFQKKFIAAVFGASGPDEADRAASIRKTREEKIAAILASPTGQVRGTKDTAFSLLQASVEYIDHVRTTRSEDGVDPTEQRLLSATMGSGAELKRRAWDSILSMSQA